MKDQEIESFKADTPVGTQIIIKYNHNTILGSDNDGNIEILQLKGSLKGYVARHGMLSVVLTPKPVAEEVSFFRSLVQELLGNMESCPYIDVKSWKIINK